MALHVDPSMGVSPGAALAGEILRSSGLSQAELARRAGLPRSVVNAYVWGHREPGADTLARLAAAGGLRPRTGSSQVAGGRGEGRSAPGAGPRARRGAPISSQSGA